MLLQTALPTATMRAGHYENIQASTPERQTLQDLEKRAKYGLKMKGYYNANVYFIQDTRYNDGCRWSRRCNACWRCKCIVLRNKDQLLLRGQQVPCLLRKEEIVCFFHLTI